MANEVTEAHNGYLEVLIELGFIGLMLVSMFLLSATWKAQSELTHDFDWGSLCICYLLMTVLHNITESSINSFASHLMAITLFLTITLTSTTSYMTNYKKA